MIIISSRRLYVTTMNHEIRKITESIAISCQAQFARTSCLAINGKRILISKYESIDRQCTAVTQNQIDIAFETDIAINGYIFFNQISTCIPKYNRRRRSNQIKLVAGYIF